MYNFGTALELTETKMNKLRKPIDIEVTTLNEWDKQEVEYLDIATPLIKEMVQYLYPAPEVVEMAKDSVGDQIAKIDLVLKYPEIVEDGVVVSDGRLVGFQVKSSLKGAELHMEKNKEGSFYDGVFWPCPGVFWCDEISLESVIALAKFTGGCLNPEISEAIALLDKIKDLASKCEQGLYFEAKAIQKKLITNPIVWKALKEFGIVYIAGGRMFYVNS